ncbi:ATP-dependent RNA helicase-like protein [Leishmania infantum JPCM5]|uniref:RNA helicase n=2 Tax=Leishmania infantum TaxID=5671 RepID=A4I9T1_LEIIN|nr:ATP-dependent RNA helicase-like protein [Leishmania infantum JPCM5]CAM71584.2 ATP-dependent RNA helicase-like protein [Leishmania infantum JPCM5]|eukprot:XP_001468500.2 ATP-dependent RNA helicase-like protein [Leishmania infantum JPCM5]
MRAFPHCLIRSHDFSAAAAVSTVRDSLLCLRSRPWHVQVSHTRQWDCGTCVPLRLATSARHVANGGAGTARELANNRALSPSLSSAAPRYRSRECGSIGSRASPQPRRVARCRAKTSTSSPAKVVDSLAAKPPASRAASLASLLHRLGTVESSNTQGQQPTLPVSSAQRASRSLPMPFSSTESEAPAALGSPTPVPRRGSGDSLDNSAAASEPSRASNSQQRHPNGSAEAHSSGNPQAQQSTSSAIRRQKVPMVQLQSDRRGRLRKPSASRMRSLPGGNLADAAGVSPLAVDRGAEERVVAMLRSDHQQADPDAEFVMPEPSMRHVPHSQLLRCVLELPLNGRCHGEDTAEKEVFAIGQSRKAKVARALCFMHAEQLLDHYMSTRATPLSSRTGASPAPPPLEERALPPRPKTPKPHDYRSWDEYVDASAAYVQALAARVRQEACTREEVPRSGHPVADRATELLRRHPKRYCRPTVLHELNGSIRDASSLMTVAHLEKTVFVATLALDPQTGLTATGVAKNTKTAKRQCAAHALCILRLLQEDAEGRQGADGTGRSRRRGAQKGTRSKKDVSHHPSAPLESVLRQMQPAYRKLVQYHHLLFGKASLTPQTTFTKQSSTTSGSTSTTVYRCHLTLNGLSCDGTGINRFEAERAAMETAMANLMLYDKRIQAVQAFVNAHPSISPESIPSAALPAELVVELQTQLRPVTEQQAATEGATGRSGCDDGSDSAGDCGDRARGMSERTLLRLSERAFATDPSYAAQMLHDILHLRRDPVYLTQFHPRRSTLAMATVKAQVLDAVQRHRVAVVCGTTGCGKTTQVPQYILDYEIEHGRGGSCNILVTQPRRLSAFSVAERIAQERLSTVGKDVGYAVRLDSRPGRHITVCTTGVLLQIFSTHPDLEHVSHLIIDEVHERDINCDVILALVKQLLTRNSRLRVVLMSATMQADVFARYFDADTPVVQVEGAVYPVAIRYLEDIASEAATAQFYSPAFDAVSSREQGHQVEQQEKTPTKSVSLAMPTTTASQRVNRRKLLKTDYNLVAYLVHRAVQVDLQNNTEGKSILVFLPGWKELTSAMAAIKEYQGPYALSAAESRLHIILLHSTVDSAKQRECFMPAPSGTVKVVLATNIAESGITIDDVAVVIDTGLIKTTTWESRPTATYHQHVTTGTGASSSSGSPTFAHVPLDKVAVNCGPGGGSGGDAVAPAPVFSTQLTLGYASQANCTQRKGRAGRTQGGVCYRLFTKELWESLPAFPEADIHRVPLMQVLLKLLSLGHANPKETLQTFLEPPSNTNVDASMEVLRGIGAIGKKDRLTPLGEYLALLPCDPRIGKMILVGTVLRCLDSVLTVAACTDVCPYATSRDVAAEARKKRYLLSCGSQSDHISFLNAYNAFCANGEKDDFAALNLLHTGNLRVISKYKVQYRDILRHAGLISPQDEFGRDSERVDSTDAVPCPEHGHLGNDGGTVEDTAIHSEGGKATASAVDSSAQGAPASGSAPLSYPGTLCVDTNALSRHSFDVALVKACVCAALFPNVALLRPPSKALSSMQRLRAARKVELRTKHFASIKPAKDSVCRRVDGSRGDEVPDRDEVLSQLTLDSRAATADSATSSTSPDRPVPALFYVFQDVFGLREPRRDFLTSLSAVSLWALLLFGASESTTEYNAELSICVVDGWIALHIDRATYALVTQLRQSLFECLRGKYNNPQDPRNNSALETVTAVCRRLLKAPVLEMAAAKSPDTAGSAAAGRQQSPWQLVDMGSIVDPLVHLRHGDFGDGRAAAVAGEDALLDLDSDDDGDDDEDLPNFNPVDGDDDDDDKSSTAHGGRIK